MDKTVGNKKPPAGTTRKAYNIFSGIINLTQQHQSYKSDALPLSSSSGGRNDPTVGGGKGTTSLDPQGSPANVYTVPVTSSENLDKTNQVKTCNNSTKRNDDQSTSGVSSLTAPPNNSTGMNPDSGTNNGKNRTGSSGPIGPAPRTVSILTALNELVISDEIKPNPTCSTTAPSFPPVSIDSNRNGNNSTISQTNYPNTSTSSRVYSLDQYQSNTQSQYRNVNSSHSVKNKNFRGNQSHLKSENDTKPPAEGTRSAISISSPTVVAPLHHTQRPQKQHYHSSQHHTAHHSGPNSSTTSYVSSPVNHSKNPSGSGSGGIYSTNTRIVSNKDNLTTDAYSHHLGKSYCKHKTLPSSTLLQTNAVSRNNTIPSCYDQVTPGTIPLTLGRTYSTTDARTSRHKSLRSHKESRIRKNSTSQHDGLKSGTPDWICNIFQLTKHGKLEQLKEALRGLDPTLIRHLADAKGNTVLHCAARGGHVNTLQWLVSILGSQCTEAALSDHNQAGRTVILTALKKGKLDCIRWLVHHTKSGEKALIPNDGERSLLHHAAAHGDLNAVRWLSTELIDKRISVDIRDAVGMTPLHQAAKLGHINICHELILAGADPLSQTELGWRPSDVAIRHRHMDCARYFMVAEAAGSLGNQLHSLLHTFNVLRQEHEDLRTHFRETLRVGKWLAKERNELIKHFPSKWPVEGPASNSCTTGGGGIGAPSVVASQHSLLLGGTNNGTRFSDLEHKLVVAEQAWKALSPNMDETTCILDGLINGENETSLLSNASSHDFLHRRLLTVHVLHERQQNAGGSMLGNSSSSDAEEYSANSSSDEASNRDVGDTEDIFDADATNSVAAGMMISMVGKKSPAGLHPSSVSSSDHHQHMSGSSKIRTRPSSSSTSNRAAPWLLPPNDAFLSQLSPFVDGGTRTAANCVNVEKALPTLDLLHGAPSSSSSTLSPTVAPNSPSSAVSSSIHHLLPTTKVVPTECDLHCDGDNERPFGQPLERNIANARGKSRSVNDHNAATTTSPTREGDPIAHDISVLEVIEPIANNSPEGRVSTLKKDPRHQIAPDLISGTHGHTVGRIKHEVTVNKCEDMKAQQLHQLFPLRGITRFRKVLLSSRSEENLLDNRELRNTDALYEPISTPHFDDKGREKMAVSGTEYVAGIPHHRQSYQHHTQSVTSRRLSNDPSLQQSLSDNKGGITDADGKGHSVERIANKPPSKCQNVQGGNEQLQVLSRPASSLSVMVSPSRRKSACGKHQQHEEKSGMWMIAVHGSREAASNSNVAFCDGESKVIFPSYRNCASSVFDSDYVTSANNSNSKPSTSRAVSKTPTASPKSYVTKLTVIPAETTTETCFLSLRSPAQEADRASPKQQRTSQEQNNTFHEPGRMGSDYNEYDTEKDMQEDEEASSHQSHLPGDKSDELIAFSCQIPSYSVSSSNTPVMPRFNSSGTVVFPSRKPSLSEWHSAELLSRTTPESSLADRLSPTQSETSRTESALAPPPSYVSHASQNSSEVSKTESARGNNERLSMYEVNVRDDDDPNLDSRMVQDFNDRGSFINNPTTQQTRNNENLTIVNFEAGHQLTFNLGPSLSPRENIFSRSENNAEVRDNLTGRLVLSKNSPAPALSPVASECLNPTRQKKNNSSGVANMKKHERNGDENDDDDDASPYFNTTTSSAVASEDAAVDDDQNRDGDNDRSTLKQSALFEKNQYQTKCSNGTVPTTSRSIRSHLSTSTSMNAPRAGGSGGRSSSGGARHHQRLPKGHRHHHHLRGHSKPWYEIEGSDDEGSLLRVVTSRSSHSSNFSHCTDSCNSSSNNNISSGNSDTRSNLDDSSSQLDEMIASASEQNPNNNVEHNDISSSDVNTSENGTEAEREGRHDHDEVKVQKAEQSEPCCETEVESRQQQDQQIPEENQQQQIYSTTMTPNKRHNYSNFL